MANSLAQKKFHTVAVKNIILRINARNPALSPGLSLSRAFRE